MNPPDNLRICVLDTNVFNWLIDRIIDDSALPEQCILAVTHLQIDEINKTQNSERRAQLFLAAMSRVTRVLPTETLVFDLSRWDNAKWGDGACFKLVKEGLDLRNKGKPNNSVDALIAEVAILNRYELITADTDLAELTQQLSGAVILLKSPSDGASRA